MAKIKRKLTREEKNAYLADFAIILSHMKRFRKAILTAREKWNIPKDGLKTDDRAAWYSAFFTNPDIDTGDSHYSDAHNKFIPPNQLIRSTLDDVIGQFNLDHRWYFNLFQHIAIDTPLEAPPVLPYVERRINDVRLPKKELIVEKLWIQIYPDTSREDILDIWDQVEECQKMMRSPISKKRKPLVNVWKYIKIRNLEDQKVSQRDIVEKYPEFKFTDEKQVSEFKKQIEQRFSPNRKKK